MALDRNDYNDPAQPSFGKATVSIDTPNIADISVVEEFPGSPENYRPLPYGTPHPKNPETGLDLRLVWQGPVKAANNQVRIKRVYSTEPLSQNWYNFAVKYSGDETAAPIYVRTYLTLRDDYAPAATRQPLTGITQLRMTSGGSGYTSDPTITFTGGGGSGASALPIRDVQSGEIVGLRIVSEGSGYTSPPTVAITGGAGTGATAVAAIQPTDAVLVKEETQRLENDNPQKASLFIRVHRVYETLPGPWLNSSRFDDDGAVIAIASRRVLSGSSSLGETFDPGTSTLHKTTEKADESSVVALEVVESRAIPGPWNTTTRQGYDGLTVTVQSRKQLLADITSNESVGSGIWTKRFAKPVDGSSLLALEVIETRAVPGLGVPKTEVDEAGNITTVTRTLVVKSTLATTTVVSGGTWTRTYEEPVEDSNLVAWKVVAVRPAPNTMPEFTIEIPDLVPEQFRADIPIETTKTRVTGTASMPTLGTGDIRRTERQVDQQSYELIITTRGHISIPVTVTGLKETNEKKQVVTVSLTLESDATTPTSPTATKDVDFRKLGNGLAVEIIRTVPAVFQGKHREIGTPLVIPERFRAAVGINTKEDIVAGTVPNTVSLGAGEVERQETELTELTKRVRTTVFSLDDAPTLHGQTLDQRFGINIPYTETLEESGTSLGDANKAVEPLSDQVDLVRSPGTTPPSPQVTYGRLRVPLPIELIDVEIIGSEALEAVPTYRHPPELALFSRTTRSFTVGPPTEPSEPSLADLLQPQPFHAAVEYLETRESSHSRDSTSESSRTADETRDFTSSRTSNETRDSTSSRSSDETRNTTSDRDSTETRDSDSTSTGDTDSTHTHDSTENSNSHTSHSTDSDGGDDLSTDSDFGGSSVVRTYVSASNTDSNTATDGDSSGSGNNTSTNTETGTSNSSGTSTDNSTADTTSTSTEDSTGSSTSDSTEDGGGTSGSTSSEDSSSTGTSSSDDSDTGRALLRVNFPATLHDLISTDLFDIPATVPPALPWGDWFIVDDTVNHIRDGIWVRTLVEAKLPSL